MINQGIRLVKRAIKTSCYPFLKSYQVVPIKPSFISLAVSETCFFRCKHCDIWKLKRQSDWMSTKQIKAVLRKIYNWMGNCTVAFSGGEPFLNPDFIDIVQYANKLGLNTHVNTNGFLLNEEIVKKVIDAGIKSLHVSIDGVGKTHDQSRGKKGAFAKAEKTIDLLVKYRDLSSKKLELATTTILLKSNVKQIKSMLSWGKKEGLDAMYFQALWENFGVLQHDPKWFNKSDCWPKRSEAVKAVRELIGLKKTGEIVGNTYTELKDYFNYYSNGPIKFGLSHDCYVGVRNFAIALNGDVRLCYQFEPLGNVLRDGLERIWNNRKAQNQRRIINKCQRGCKVLLCNRKLSLMDVVEKAGKKLRFKQR